MRMEAGWTSGYVSAVPPFLVRLHSLLKAHRLERGANRNLHGKLPRTVLQEVAIEYAGRIMPTRDELKALIVGAALRSAFRRASSKVESQESCIHLMLSHTTRARPVLRCSPLLSRHKKWKENGYK
jgi:hypothetical protein